MKLYIYFFYFFLNIVIGIKLPNLYSVIESHEAKKKFLSSCDQLIKLFDTDLMHFKSEDGHSYIIVENHQNFYALIIGDSFPKVSHIYKYNNGELSEDIDYGYIGCIYEHITLKDSNKKHLELDKSIFYIKSEGLDRTQQSTSPTINAKDSHASSHCKDLRDDKTIRFDKFRELVADLLLKAIKLIKYDGRIFIFNEKRNIYLTPTESEPIKILNDFKECALEDTLIFLVNDTLYAVIKNKLTETASISLLNKYNPESKEWEKVVHKLPNGTNQQYYLEKIYILKDSNDVQLIFNSDGNNTLIFNSKHQRIKYYKVAVGIPLGDDLEKNRSLSLLNKISISPDKIVHSSEVIKPFESQTISDVPNIITQFKQYFKILLFKLNTNRFYAILKSIDIKDSAKTNYYLYRLFGDKWQRYGSDNATEPFYYLGFHEDSDGPGNYGFYFVSTKSEQNKVKIPFETIKSFYLLK